MKTRLLFLSLFLAVIAFGFAVDDEPVKKILTQLDKYRAEYPQEKVHIHLDKPYYAIGDNIWFKAYVVNAEKNQLSNLSKILYVELINEKDSVKQSVMLDVKAGLAWGDFTLTDSLREGNYRIRAYTTWMRNFGNEYYFDKTISIGNSVSNNIYTDANYTFSKIGANNHKVVADIKYTYLDGIPVSKKEVTYDVQLNFRSVAKGKGTTDSIGNFKITFNNNQPFILKSGKILTIIKLEESMVSKIIPIKATSNDVDVKFFPESGDLVAGLRSKVAFKAVGADGLSIPISGFISDNSAAKVSEFETEHAGMGSFALFPEAGKVYTAHVKFEDGSEKTYPLPRVLPQGYVLSVNNLGPDKLIVKVQASQSVVSDSEVTLVAQSNGNTIYISKSKFDSRTLLAEVPKTRFPTGIIQFTLFSQQNEPLAERLIFMNHSDNLNLTLKSDKVVYSKREKVKINIDVKDHTGKPAVGSFSLAVTDESKTPYDENKETTILSNLLLTSDLKGYIEQPNYYFSGINDAKIKHLDNLMLTQGWRRFTWRNILANNFPNLSFQPESTVQISGSVRTITEKPVVGGKVTLLSSEGEVFMMDTLTDKSGRFNFPNLYFNDSTKFVIQARNAKGKKNVVIELDRTSPQLVTRSKNEAEIDVNINKTLDVYLKNSRNQFDNLVKNGLRNRSIMLAEVKIVEKKKLAKNSSNLNGAGNADNIITSEQLRSCLSLTQCLQGMVSGLVIQNGIAYLTRSMYSSFSGLVPMQLIIDGMYVDANFLDNINPIDVDAIEVLKSGGNTAIYGIRGGGGVLIITTKRGERNLNYSRYASGIASYNPKGYYKTRQFYSPNYANPKEQPEVKDLRTTIYWNPNIITDSLGKASVEFYNADGTGSYRAIIEGLNADGKLGRYIYKYTVE
ncbi:MAG: hypothetical protein JWN56_2039 [Sphingobacteriales bacterium]|nr:hypothetical protein [Sphingobacteriales bacterium]